jgi:hypothetical protein
MAKFVGGQYQNMLKVGVNQAGEALSKGVKLGADTEVEFQADLDGPTVSDKQGQLGIGARLAGDAPPATGSVDIDVTQENRQAFDGNGKVMFRVKYVHGKTPPA